MFTGNWMIDFRGESRSQMYPISETLISTHTHYQQVLIAQSPGYGKMLFLDGTLQTAEADEHIYHEALIHPAMVAHPNPRSVFIAGGGEGAVLRDVLRHNTVEKVVMVDIDRELIALVKEYLPEWHGSAFDDPRVEVLHDDARAHLLTHPDTYDCIYGDLPDPTEGGPAAALFTRDFFDLVKARLNPGGLYALQAEPSEAGWCRAHITIIKELQQSFTWVKPYQALLPSFGEAWGFAVASNTAYDERFTPQAIDHTLHERTCQGLRFYDGETHMHMFALPKHLRTALSDPEVYASLRNAIPLAVQ
jgi:spermidine synthase